jgi:hypothetical protein
MSIELRRAGMVTAALPANNQTLGGSIWEEMVVEMTAGTRIRSPGPLPAPMAATQDRTHTGMRRRTSDQNTNLDGHLLVTGAHRPAVSRADRLGGLTPSRIRAHRTIGASGGIPVPTDGS